MQRIVVDREPFIMPGEFKPGWAWPTWGEWPVMWVDHPERGALTPSATAYRLKLTLEAPATIRMHISADNRYRLFVDGERQGEGPERGDLQHWYFETYEGRFDAGEHWFAVLTWWLGDLAPYAQLSHRPGFLFACEGEFRDRLSTGRASWEAALVPGLEAVPCKTAAEAGSKIKVDGVTYPWGWERGQDCLRWQPAVPVANAVSAAWKNEIPPAWMLLPATLPNPFTGVARGGKVRYVAEGDDPYPVDLAQRHLAGEAAAWEEWIEGRRNLTVPAHSARTVLVDWNDYLCAYPELRVSGGRGARIQVNWAEGLYATRERSEPGGDHKGHRDAVDQKYFRHGVGDEFLPDGGQARIFTTLWWESGRYVELVVRTGDEALLLESLTLRLTGYPLRLEGAFSMPGTGVDELRPMMERTVQRCSHETYMDCPYYEQMMYVGDTRLEALITYVMTADDRLPRKAITMFDWSRRNTGFTQSRYPSRVCQIIPPFSLWWVAMVHDYWMWRGDPDFVKERLAGVRSVLEAFRVLVGADGLMGAPRGWNFCDWVKEPEEWLAGVAPGAEFEPSALLNLQLALVLRQKAEMEEWFGEPLLAERDRRLSEAVGRAVMRVYWNEEAGLISDGSQRAVFSEHVQCLAILWGGMRDEEQRRVVAGLRSGDRLVRTTIYFSHYFLEACRMAGLEDRVWERLGFWSSLQEAGFKTTSESPEPSRSDCHAWGAHPLFHAYATILGIRPSRPGFDEVSIAPMRFRTGAVEARMPHPRGMIELSLECGAEGGLHGTIELPGGTAGRFSYGGCAFRLNGGRNQIALGAL